MGLRGAPILMQLAGLIEISLIPPQWLEHTPWSKSTWQAVLNSCIGMREWPGKRRTSQFWYLMLLEDGAVLPPAWDYNGESTPVQMMNG